MKCAKCKKIILGIFYKEGSKFYHEKCYLDLRNLYCVVCGQSISGRYLIDTWGNKSHINHNNNLCDSCGRIIAQKTTGGGFVHHDGRKICRECLSTSVKDENQVQANNIYILSLLNGVGFSDIPADIEIELVNRTEMIKKSGHKDNYGLASISKTAGIFNKSFLSAKIFILDYLPAIQFKGVLAHELLHVWLAAHNIDLKKYEEALCNIGSTLVYNSLKKNKLADVLNEQMKINSDPDYGIRYMKLKSKLKSQGWASFLEDIKAGNFR